MKHTQALLAVPVLLVAASCSAKTAPESETTPPLVVPSVPPQVTATPGQAMDDPVAEPSPSPMLGPLVDDRADQPVGKSGKPRGQTVAPTSAVAGTTPDQVAQVFSRTLWTWDSAIDTSPNDAGRRAVSLAAPAYAKALAAARSKTSPGAEWAQMASHRGFTKITTATLGGLGEAPADSATTAARAVTIQGSYLGTHKWSSPLGPHTLLVYMEKNSGQWRVTRTEVLS